MTDREIDPEIDPGLCRRCVFVRRIKSAKGSVFWLCRQHETDPAWPKYPPIPVRHCPRFKGTE